ncbi:MAG: lactoylglutathione lyase [Lachnospiraceae bacterium]|nr:lactoylglutathione lyase [Lachnospiraceae bacterium]
MSNLKIHHIGYLVKKIEAATRTFEALGYQLAQNIVYDDIRKVNICFMTKDDYCIELVAPTAEDSVVSGLMKKYKNCPYHICYETNNFDQDYQELLENGFISIDVPTPAPALQGRDVVFLTNALIGMIELLRS